MKNQKRKTAKAERYKKSIAVSEGVTINLDLNRKETRWLRRLGATFGLSIEEFVLAHVRNQLPRPYFGSTQQDEIPPSIRDTLTINCSDPQLWKQLQSVAKHCGKDVRVFCGEELLRTLQMFNEDVIFHPRTGEVLAEDGAIRELYFSPADREILASNRGFVRTEAGIEPLPAAEEV
jgi:hypothetical protein